ncbi:hypothetical protein ACIQF5_06795 [Streptomyces goshikiensis]|uniref:hypothetical protein n=1 Tax=Streptomyces goshikiensis TaxID=1942 RepID=UPI0038019934
MIVPEGARRQAFAVVRCVANGGFTLGPPLGGLILALNGAVILVLELPAAVALRNRPPLRVVGVGLLFVGAGYAALLAGTGVAAAVAMMVLLSLGEILYKTTATAPEHAIGRFQSLYAGVSVSGVVLGAPLGGALYSAAPGLLWPVCAVLAAGAGAAVLWVSSRQGRHAARPAHETGSRRQPVAG